MLALENADEILQILDRYTKQKSKDIPPELEEYINYVAKTGDTVYRWPTVQYLFREKLRYVIKDFHDTTASIEDLPQCPNVDQFNYDSMKTLLFERFDNFQAAPFTIQRLCELLTDPKKHYSRLDKFMRALEKNILVVSTVEPGRKPIEPDTDIHIMSEINELKKNNDSLHVKHIDNGNHIDSNDPSSSKEGENDIKKEEKNIEENTISEKSKEKSDESIVKSESQIEIDIDTVKNEEPVETKSTVSVEKMDAEQEENGVAKTDEITPTENAEKIENGKIESDIKEASAEEKPTELVVEKKEDAEVKEKPTVDEANETNETVEIEKPPTPKRRSSSDNEEVDNDDENISIPIAKKIRLDLNDDKKIDAETKPDPESSDAPLVDQPIVAEPVLPKETDILESISTEIDAQKESELLDDVVDSALAAEKDPIKIDVQPIEEIVAPSEEAKPAEVIPAADDLLKAEEPVATIPSDLDFTPDEALNELVSSDILSVIPEQSAEEEVKMNDEAENVTEPAAPPADEMNVENTENNAPEVESAMEAAPIKTDEEQMDVDESNSVDAMDL